MLEFRPQELRCDTAPPRHLEFVVLPCYANRRSNSSAKTSGREKWADACESATNTSGCAITRCTNSESFVHDLETPRGIVGLHQLDRAFAAFDMDFIESVDGFSSGSSTPTRRATSTVAVFDVWPAFRSRGILKVYVWDGAISCPRAAQNQ